MCNQFYKLLRTPHRHWRYAKGTGVMPKALALCQRHLRYAKGTGVSPFSVFLRKLKQPRPKLNRLCDGVSNLIRTKFS